MGGNGAGGMKVMYIVWGWLLALTVVEVVLAYFQVPLLVMLLILLGLSLIELRERPWHPSWPLI